MSRWGGLESELGFEKLLCFYADYSQQLRGGGGGELCLAEMEEREVRGKKGIGNKVVLSVCSEQVQVRGGVYPRRQGRT
jgi:hypothetical protein